MATESYEDDDLLLPLPEEAPSSLVRLKLKRLKKSSKSSPKPPIGVLGADPVVPAVDYGSGLPDHVLDPLFSVPAADEGFETLDLEVEEEEEEKKEKSARKRLSMEEEGKEEASEKKKNTKKKRNSSEELARGRRRRMEEEMQAHFEHIRVYDGAPAVPVLDSISDLPDDGLDPLFLVPAADEDFETLDLEEAMKKTKKSARKRLSMEEEEEVSKKKKKNKKRSSSEEPAREKKRMEKDRQARLEQIHAESQRLLRETRNASFKPVPLVQKPISSVLEKIRLRKLEVLKRSGVLVESDRLVNEIVETCEPNKSQAGVRDDDGDVEVEDHVEVEGVGSGGRPLDPCGSIPCNSDSLPELNGASTSTDEREDSVELNFASHTSTNERENVAKSSKPTDDNQLNDLEDSSDANLPTSNINHDHDNLSSEEDDDKENIAPHISDTVNMGSSPSGGLAKLFIDDEAEEEDDSDHDIMRFKENEEDDESDENDLDDLIATGYEEAPVDNEKRNELHQKWLEQQDAAGTDNLLQKLHCGQREREPTSLDEEDSDESGEEYDDEESNDLPVTSVVRQNAKKAKQMIAQMFTDGDDMYVPSDDEESEQTLMRQRVLKQSGESLFISPVEDEHSREVFGLIKKLNAAPTTKRRGKITSSFDTLVGNSNSSSKTSFLNRTSSNSLPSLRKQGSATMRAFIFSRDDSNSMSSIQASEKISETDLKENQPSRAGGASTKIRSCSQFKSTTSKTTDTNSSSGASLFEILRHSSMHFNRQLKNKGTSSHEITESQASYQFSAFNLRNRK